MSSPNLAVPHVAAAQNQKEVTINDAINALDNSINRTLALEMADADLTLTSDQANRNGLIILTGTLTAERIVTMPANHQRLAICNATTGGQQIRVNYPGAGTDIVVAAGEALLVQGDGDDLYAVSANSVV